MKATTRGRKCRMRVALTVDEAVAGVAGAECAWEFPEWAEVRTADAGAVGATKAMKTASPRE